jgi:hypothetical protein
MYRTRASLFAAAVLALALTFAISAPVKAQSSDDGTGAGAGNSPPIEQLRGTAMPDAASRMDAPTMPPDENAGQAAPKENNTAAPEENKKYDGPADPD